MSTSISWKLVLDVQGGPKVLITNAVQVDAFDRIEVTVPDTTGSATATTVDVQPSAVGKVKVLLIRSNRYGDDLKFRIHDNTTDERALNDAIFLAGAGSLDLLEDPSAPLDKLLITNTTGQDVFVEIIVGRSAV
jgi:hypothetical protein